MQFIGAIGSALSETRPEINAIPKVDGGLFRLNRDTRFSRDKTPYKTHIGILLWKGTQGTSGDTGLLKKVHKNL
ncbi:MAG: hypothetical protein CO090_07115 [Acidobacteria bacterium CG_4_9_14_3_um_filter_49_7]|nr:MAG: hypothetical protein CO090_07115 [Acidobacteria bacterium CG_4_9_14_3_um_filter_49_7]